MTATKGFTAKGIVLSIGTPGAGETFTPITQVKQFQFSGVTCKFEDITNLGSPSVGAAVLEEALPSSVNPGTATFSGVFLTSDLGQLALVTAWNAQLIADWKLQLPKGPDQTTSGNLYSFSGYIQDMPIPDTYDTGKPITFKVTIKLNTIITIAPGS